MNNCYISLSTYPSASLSAFYELTQVESTIGNDVTVIVFGNQKTGVIQDEVNHVKIVKLPYNPDQNKILRKISFAVYAFSFLRNQEYDVVNIFHELGFSIFPIFLSYKKKTRWIYHIRSGPITPGIKRKLGVLLLRLDTLFFHRVTFGSEGTRRIVFGDKRKDLPIISVGVNLERFKKKEINSSNNWGVLSSDKNLIYIGSLNTARKLSVLIKAVKKVVVDYKVDVKLVIVGSGSDMPRLQNLTKELGVGQSVLFIGQIPYEKIPDILSLGTIGLGYVPNTAELGPQPALKTVEMLACGLPVIGTDTEGNRLFIQNGVNGVLVKDTECEIAKAIADLIGNEAELERYRKIARDSIQKFDYRNVFINSVLPIYQSMMDTKR